MLSRIRRHPSFHLIAYSVSGGLIPLVGLLFSPLTLRKLGLADYGSMGLALFVSSILITIADFGLQSHLLSLGSRSGGRVRREDVVACVFLRLLLFLVVAAGYLAYFWWFPHPVEVRMLAGLYLISLIVTPSQFEWFYIGRQSYRLLIFSRLVCAALFVCLNLVWLASPYGVFGLPLVVAGSQAAASAILLGGMRPSLRWLQALETVPSAAQVFGLLARLSPLAGTQILSFFFLGSGVFLLDRIGGEGRIIGAYSIANRLTMGLMALIAPLILFFIPKMSVGGPPVLRGRPVVLSLGCLGLLALLGVVTIHVFYAVSQRDIQFQDYSVQVFLILTLGTALNLARVPSVSYLVATSRYRAYFLLHLAACIPVLAVIFFPGLLAGYGWVPWMACVPEALATVGAITLAGRKASAPRRSGS